MNKGNSTIVIYVVTIQKWVQLYDILAFRGNGLWKVSYYKTSCRFELAPIWNFGTQYCVRGIICIYCETLRRTGAVFWYTGMC